MATSLQTTNYGFGKYAPNDVTSYLTDYNGTMDKIDGAIKSVSDVANEAKATGDSNLNNIANLSQGLTATNKNVENLSKAQTAQGAEIEEIKNDISKIEIGEYNEYAMQNNKGSGSYTLYARKVGNGIQGAMSFGIHAGTYNIDRNIDGVNLIDIAQMAGNVFSLTANKLLYCYAMLEKASVYNGYSLFAFVYDSATNFTRFCIVEKSTSYESQEVYGFVNI